MAMTTHKTLLLAACLTCGFLTNGCAIDTADDFSTEAPGLETASLGQHHIFITETGFREGVFYVDVLLNADVLRQPGARFLVTQLDYMTPEGLEPSPFAAIPIGEVDFTRVSRTQLTATLEVEGPAPRNIDDVVGRVSANPTPHP